MVTITNFKQVETKEGKVFIAIELMGDAKLVQSETTGKFYLSAHRTKVPTSFSPKICQTLLGQKLPGTIEKVSCEPYEYANPDTGEILTLDYTYVYSPEERNVQTIQSMQSSYSNIQQQPLMYQQNQMPLGQFNLSRVIGEA